MAGATPRGSRVSFTRVVTAGLILGAGGFGVLRVTNAEPIPVAPPVSLAEPRPDPNLPALPTPGSFPLPVAPAIPTTPALPVPTLPTPEPLPLVPALPTAVLPMSEPLPVVPGLPKAAEVVLPAPTANPEKGLRPAPMPLNLIVREPTRPTPLAPEALPAGNETPQPPRKIGNEIAVPPKPVGDLVPSPRSVSLPADMKPPASFVFAPPPIAPGDAPMLPLKKLSLSTALGVALALAPTSAVRAEEPKTQDVKAVEEALKKEIKDLKDELKKSKELMGVLDEQVMGRKDGTVVAPADAGLMKRMAKLETAIKSIDTKLAALDEAMTKRTVGSSPLEGNKPAAGMGKVKVVNEFATKTTIVVNGTSYPIDPTQTKEIEVPTGSFNYLLIADGSVKTNSAIKEGETVTLRIR